jgi:hypothetical protein
MPLLTQTKAKKELREATGRSVEWCEATIRTMKKVQDGLRFKVSTYQLEKAITAANREIEWNDAPAPKGVKPLSSRKLDRIAEHCI